MANKEKKKCPFNRERFNQVLKYRKTNIKELCSDLSQGYGYSVKTISRALKSGYASFEVVEWLSEKLDIDPEFIMGKYWYDPQKYGEKAEMLNACIRPERFPYLKKLQRDKTDGKFLYDKYIENILVIHDISYKQYEMLDFDTRKQFQLEIEDVITNVLMKYFTHNAMGDELYPVILGLYAQIDSYDPSEPDEPDDLE